MTLTSFATRLTSLSHSTLHMTGSHISVRMTFGARLLPTRSASPLTSFSAIRCNAVDAASTRSFSSVSTPLMRRVQRDTRAAWSLLSSSGVRLFSSRLSSPSLIPHSLIKQTAQQSSGAASAAAAASSPFSSFLRNLSLFTAIFSTGLISYHYATSEEQRQLVATYLPQLYQREEEHYYSVHRPSAAPHTLLSTSGAPSFLTNMPVPLQAMLALNLAVFAAHHVGPLSGVMFKHFYTSWDHVVQAKLRHTLLTAVFSHATFGHLFFNCFTLASISPLIVRLMGDAEFTGFYLAAGVFSSIFGVATSNYLVKPEFRYYSRSIPSLGASGALFGVLGVILAVFPERTYSIMFIPYPIRADVLIPAAAAFDLGGLAYKYVKGPMHGFALGHGAHFGGLLFGYVYANTILKANHPEVKLRMAQNEYLRKRGLTRAF